MKQIFFFFGLFISCALFSQNDSAELVQHLSFADTVFGVEDKYQVCFPKDHRNFFLSIFSFALLSALMGLILVLKTKKHNKALHEINELVEEKNQELIDSITYSKRIQHTILPKDEEIKSALPESFVFYQPKDIVSGDFYWFFDDDEYAFVAVVDCTGHGVPGAFLSLIGNNAIHKAVKEEGLRDPSQILDRMNSLVKQMLKQQGDTELKDGMEVALCRIAKATNDVVFSGANLTLTQVSSGEVIVHKGSKCTVGSVQEHVAQPPTNNIITINNGDTLYMTSDGYLDQFGGKEGKKFKSSGFKNTLLSIQQKSMDEQLIALKTVFTDWKGNNEQIDDVCVIGIKL